MPLKNLNKPFEAYRGDAPYVFVSYAHQDKEAVFIELVRLKKLGFNVWYDEGLSPGSRWSDELAERIANCALFVYFVTPRSAESINCQDEASFVLEAGNPFLAVHLEETELPPGLKLRMGPRQAIFRYKLDGDTYQSKLYDAIAAQAPELVQQDLKQGFMLGDYEFEPLAGTVTEPGGATRHLEPKVMDVLVILSQRANEIVTREQLLDAVWPGQVAADELLTRAISELRRALRDERGDPKYIETVPKRGYRLIGRVRVPSVVAGRGAIIEPKPISQGIPRRWAYSIVGLVALAVVAIFLYELVDEPVDTPAADAAGPDASSMVSAAPSRPRPLTSMEGLERQPAMSPDGNYVAFMWQKRHHTFEVDTVDRRGDIYVLPLSGDTPIPLAATEQSESHPTWSPDSTKVAFVRLGDVDSDMEIVVKPILGGTEQVVAQVWTAQGLDWSPNGDYLAYVGKTAQDAPLHIYLVSMETGETSQFTPPTEQIQPAPPVFSPDGESLAYIRYTDPNRGIICLREIAGQDARCITPEDQEWLVFDMDWTADSTAIVAVVGWLSGGRTALRVPVTGGDPVPLPFSYGIMYVSIARVGGRLVYSDEYQDNNLWRVPGPAATVPGEPAKLAQASTRDDFLPAYSADGTKLAFTSARSGNWEIWVSNADGSNPRQITRMGHAFGPKWHPEGEQLIFTSAGYREGISDERNWQLRPRKWQVFTVDADGGFPQAAIEDSRVTLSPRWAVDGQWFYFIEAQESGCGAQLVKRHVKSAEERVVGDCISTPVEAADGRFYFIDTEAEQFRSMPLSGGQAREEVSASCDHQFIWEAWTVWKRKLIYTDCQDLKIRMLDLDTRETRMLADIYTDDSVPRQLSLDVSPDGQWIIYTRLDRRGGDLMLVEPFQ